MNEFEKMLGNALAVSVEEQYGGYFCVGEKHRFSREYRKARRKTVLAAAKTRGGRLIPAAPQISAPPPWVVMKGVPLKKRVAIISIVVMMAVGLGSGAGASLAVGFRKSEETLEYFTLAVVDPQSSPQRIEERYYLPELPEGYRPDKIDDETKFF